MMEEYVQALERHFRALGEKIVRFEIVPHRREEEFVFISGYIQFSNDTFLHFREYVELKVTCFSF